MTSVRIVVTTEYGDVDITEQSAIRLSNGQERPTLDELLDEATAKIRRAYNLADPIVPTNQPPGVTLSDTNRYLIYRAFDDGMGGGITDIVPADEPGYFSCLWAGDDGYEAMEGIEVDGVLYSIVPESGGGLMSVYVGDDLTGGGMTNHVTVNNIQAARAHIKERTGS